MGRSARVCAAVVLACWAAAANARCVRAAQAGEAEHGGNLGAFLMEGMLGSRERLRSGVCKIAVRSLYPKSLTPEVKYDFTLSFDYGAAKVRCDMRRGDRATRLARTPSSMVLYVVGGRVVHRYDPAKELPFEDLKPVDVRILGIVNAADFASVFPFEKVRQVISEESVCEAAQEQNGLYRLSYETIVSGIARIRRTYWLDAAKDFSPVRLEDRMFGIAKGTEGLSRLIHTGQTDYLELGGAWVPQHVVLESKEAGVRHELTIEWESVNSPMAEELFELAGLDVPPGTAIIDQTLGKAIIAGKVGNERTVLRVRKNAWALILFPALALCVIGVALWWYRRRRTSPPANTTHQV